MWRRALNESVKFSLPAGIVQCVLKMSKSSVAVADSTTETRKRPFVGDLEEPSAKKTIVECDKIRRRKFALLLSYSGQGYLGMQRNPGMKTIEEDLLTAIKEAGYINEEAFATPQLIQFQRAARTDKGVSAARQVISIKLPEQTSIDTINEHLPDQIRVFSIKRTTKGFNSKGACDARTYSYTLPTFSFCVDAKMEESYRVPSEIINEVKNVLKLFEGTHNFHNFTSRKNPLDPSAHRYMMSFDCSDPFLSKGIEFCTLKVKGQSFMLHQIRKMVGLALAVVRGHTTVETISKAWAPTRIDIPVAPGLGLVLEEVHYDRYNKRYGADGIHDPLTWEDVEDKINKFKETFIHSTIVETEIQEKSMLTWIETLSYHSYDVRENERENNLQECLDCESEEPASVPNGNVASPVQTQEYQS